MSHTEPPLEASKIAPHSQEAEQNLLACALVDNTAYFIASEYVKSDDFFILRNRWVWEALTRLALRNDTIDYITAINELDSQGRLEDIGGVGYLTYLTTLVPSGSYAKAYALVIQRAAVRRRLLEAANNIAQLARDEELELSEIVTASENALYSVSEGQGRKNSASLSKVMQDYVKAVEYRYTHPNEQMGIPSGYTELDSLLGGFQNSDLLILAARPGMGKTSLMLNVAVNAARLGARVGFFSLEMNNEQLAQRIIAAETGINGQQIRNNNLSEGDWARFLQAADMVNDLPLTLDDSPILNLLNLRGKCQRLKREGGLDMVIVDYLQLMSGNTPAKAEYRVQEISALSRGLKEMAREFNIPFIVGSQLSRAVEQRSNKRPVLSDLRESGTIEQDADIVLFIYRDDAYNEASERPNEADIMVSKHRNGPTGQVSLLWDASHTRFNNLKRTEFSLEDF